MKMLARFDGTCTVCGRPLLAGTEIDWAEGAGARHTSPEACEASKAEPPPEPEAPRGERWEHFERLGALLLLKAWAFAKTMPHAPHYYTLRRHWERDEDFVWAAQLLRRAEGSYVAKFGSAKYTYLDLNEHVYWTMGSRINLPNGQPYTGLINRAFRQSVRRRECAPYDAVASRYDSRLREEASLRENAAVFGLVGNTADLDVLDVGCGTGLALDSLSLRARYTGVDPSRPLLDRLRERHPAANTVCTTLESFVPWVDGAIARYDLVLALFGTGSCLTDDELKRIPMLLRSGGRAVVMFYANDDVPQAGITDPHRRWTRGLLPGDVERIGHHVACVWRKP